MSRRRRLGLAGSRCSASPSKAIRRLGVKGAPGSAGRQALRRQPAEGGDRQVDRAAAQVFILDEPTRGIDVGARAAIYEVIADLARSGMAVVVVSSDLEEVLGLSHRVLVLSRGRQRGILRAARPTTSRSWSSPPRERRAAHADPGRPDVPRGGLRQREIAAGLPLSQCARLAAAPQGAELGIVRTIVRCRRGLRRAGGGVRGAVRAARRGVVESRARPTRCPALGAATAVYLETTLMEGDRLGISSWSATLLAAVEAMRSRPGGRGGRPADGRGGRSAGPGPGDPADGAARRADRRGTGPHVGARAGRAAPLRDAILADPKVKA